MKKGSKTKPLKQMAVQSGDEMDTYTLTIESAKYKLFSSINKDGDDDSMKYLIPISKSERDVDGVVVPNVFIQMMTADKHPFTWNYVDKHPAKDEKSPVYFLYLVPDSAYDSFAYQVPKTTAGTDMKPDTKIVQCAVKVDASHIFPILKQPEAEATDAESSKEETDTE